jgi:hypothetical protein
MIVLLGAIFSLFFLGVVVGLPIYYVYLLLIRYGDNRENCIRQLQRRSRKLELPERITLRINVTITKDK